MPNDENEFDELPVAGCQIARCYVDYAFTFSLPSDDGVFYELKIENEFTFWDSEGGEHLVDTENSPVSAGIVLSATRTSVIEAIVLSGGGLSVRFANGSRLKVEALENYEAWALAGSNGYRVISGPEGELSDWEPSGG